MDAKGEVLLTILSSLAQDESRSISENSSWGIRRRFEQGKYKISTKRFLGYDYDKNDNLVIKLDIDIEVGELIDTIEYDYPTFHLSMDCFQAKVVSGNLDLKEASDSKWLTREQLDSVEWLPTDITLIEKINKALLNDESVKYTEKNFCRFQGLIRF